jgi:hypothetical protein
MDWKEINSPHDDAGFGLPKNYQASQINKITDAIEITLPTSGYELKMLKYEDQAIKELAHELGVEFEPIKTQL